MLLCPRGCGLEIFDCVTRVHEAAPQHVSVIPTLGGRSTPFHEHTPTHREILSHVLVRAVEDPSRVRIDEAVRVLIFGQVYEQNGEKVEPCLTANLEEALFVLGENSVIPRPKDPIAFGRDVYIGGERTAGNRFKLDALHQAPLVTPGCETETKRDLAFLAIQLEFERDPMITNNAFQASRTHTFLDLL